MAVVSCGGPEASSSRVLLDGLFGEWSTATNVIDDPPDGSDSVVDILSVQALDDPSWLYLALDVGSEVGLQSMPGTLHLLFDVDDSRGTGGSMNGMDGVDLVVDLSPMVPLRPTPGAGMRVRAVAHDGTTREIERHTLGVMAAPTWSAPRFELRISRLAVPGAPPFGRRLRMKAVYERDDRTLDDTEVGSYAFASERAEVPRPAWGDVPDRPADAIRVVQWNVASGRFERYRPDFARVLAALDPDVIMLDEVPGTMGREDVRSLFDTDPLRGMGGWSFVLGDTGGRQRSLVAARTGSIRPTERLQAPGYPSGALERLRASSADVGESSLATALEAEARHGLSAAGAWVDVGDSEALFVSLDLQAGGWTGSASDLLRSVQAEAIRGHVAAELGGRPRPVVMGGDLNLVGSRAPLFALVRGLDADGSDLTALDAERLGERTLATWRLPGDFFGPGRLDFLFVSDAAVTVANAFVFATEDLDEAALVRLGLERDLMRRLSDHLVLAADLRFGAGPGSPGGSR